MKKHILLMLSVLAICSCESFLDRQPTNNLTPELLFNKRTTAMQYIATVYAQMPNFYTLSCTTNPCNAASDEVSESFRNEPAPMITFDKWTSGTDTGTSTAYIQPYRGIREATYFMQNIYSCPDTELTPTEKEYLYNEARTLRAWYYFYMFRFFGPVFMLGNDLADLDSGDRERDTWEDCVNWVVNELTEAAKGLPEEWPNPATEYGRITKGAALAIKAKVLIWSASPLMNGNKMYAGLKSKVTGEHLFPQTYDANKWKLAADAFQEVIDLNCYELVNDVVHNDPATQAALNLKKVFTTDSNKELIFVRMNAKTNSIRHTTPTQINTLSGSGWGGICVTQKLVDAFASSNGYYPFDPNKSETYSQAAPQIDPRANYSEEGHKMFVNPYFYEKGEWDTPMICCDREPRFYVNVLWSGAMWHHGTKSEGPIELWYSGASGEAINGQNAPQSGWVLYKFHDKSVDLNTTYGYGAYPIIRYAEVLLSAAEALNEYDPSDARILKYLNEVRTRAGVPAIGTGDGEIYGECVGDQDMMRELIHRERHVELCIEQQRYFDCRRWMTAEKDLTGVMYGMNVKAANDSFDGEYWKRAPMPKDNARYETSAGQGIKREFSDRCYFWPIPYAESKIVKGFTQNYGWE